jgi:hypothetical protein
VVVRREKKMASLVVGTFLTLDGVIRGLGGPDEDRSGPDEDRSGPDEDRSGGFAYGDSPSATGTAPIGKIITEWTAKADALLLGGTTARSSRRTGRTSQTTTLSARC